MKKCTEFEMEIMDAVYGEVEMSEDCKLHLAACETCQSFQESLLKLPVGTMEEKVVDEWVIGQSVKAAQAIAENRNAFERRLFLMASLALMGLGFVLVLNGFGLLLRNLYIGIYLGGPLVLPIIIWKRQQRGQDHA